MTRGRHETAIGLLAGVAAAVLASCSSSSGEAPGVRASGPARVRVEVVARHAAELDEGELASRPAGSQQEGAAAAYVLGHLQQAGYGARLERVPVANTVSSTDVLALPPAGGAPHIVVAVPYDTGAGPDGAGARVGLFLELARALAVAAPGHRVGFAALGAEATKVGGGYLGSRRLVRLLEGEGEDASIVTIEAIELEGAATFGAFGPEVSPVTDVAERLGVPVAPLPPPESVVGRELTERARVFTEAGLDHVAVAGGAAEVGRVLLEYLAAGERSPPRAEGLRVALVPSYLASLVDSTRARVTRAKGEVSEEELRRRADEALATRHFRAALEHDGFSIVAEIKRASPARGDLNRELDAGAAAAAFVGAGAVALSVLTEPEHFHGSLDDLRAAAHAGVPVLRKDFIVDPWQIPESRAAGADAVLLIVRVLRDSELASLLAATRAQGMDALVEVHDANELERALAVGADVIGVNHRDLETFEIHPGRTAELADRVPSRCLLVALSGVSSRRDVEELEAAGASAALVGESLVTAADPAAKLRELLGAP